MERLNTQEAQTLHDLHASEIFDSMCWQGTFRAQAAFPVLSLKPDAERTISAAGGSTMRHSLVVAAYEGLEQT